MAYAALVSLARLLNQILDRRQHSHPEIQQIQSLHERIVSLTTFLDDFPTEAGRLETRITVAANQAEDSFLGHENEEKLSEELREPLKEIDSILEEVMQIKSSCQRETLMLSHSSASFSTGLTPTTKRSVAGFEEDLIKIKERLCGEPCSKLEVIPIVGMGGIGKTTLARYALDDPLAVYHFDVRAWVTVSQNYHTNTVLLCLLNSIDASSKGQYMSSGTASLVQHLYQYLKGRRYLIVIDDVWNSNVWDDVRRVFPDDLNGSRIIVTTRDLDVASYVDPLINPHEMHLMGVGESWNLLKHVVFGEEQCPPELEETGELIALRCRGLPLAIVVIGGVLSKANQTEETWKSIARNVSEAVNTGDEPFAEILSLSYTFLPYHLRPCFLYMGGFPEDHEINVSKLIRLWVAEGFLKSSGSKELEEVAGDYLEDLAKRSLVLINKKRYDGKIKTVKIHDLLRDLCKSKARDENFFCIVDELSGTSPGVMENSRRLSISQNSDGFPSMDGSHLHSILFFCHWVFKSWKRFRLLRVVDASGVTQASYPEEIGELLHLRYLAARFCFEMNSYSDDIPESWSKLENLEMLIISYYRSSFTSCLPFGIWRWPKLRHLVIPSIFLAHPCAENSDQSLALQKLQTLKSLQGFICTESMLELIPNVKKLGIDYSIFDSVYETGWSKFSLNNLVHLHKLEELKIEVDEYGTLQSDLARNIAFPVTLKKLTLSGTHIPWEDMSIIGSLPDLQVLKLKHEACCGRVWETTEEQFCQLKVLVVESADPHQWITESSHFQRLERLHLHKCHRLTEIPDSIGEILTLQLIEVDLCGSSIEESAKHIEEEQLSFGNDLQAHITTSSNYWYPKL